MVATPGNHMAARMRRLLADPIGVLRRRVSLLQSSTQQVPDVALLQAVGRKARAAGFGQLYLFLSFDCDTDLDIPASRDVHDFLASIGIRMTMAVPGTQLQNGAATYSDLAGKNVEFMNHGFLPHAAWSEDRYVSITFYHEMTSDAVAEDIRNGHSAVTKITGRPPAGFRAPHFGLYQEPEQLTLVYQTARELGYQYCSTTTPIAGHRYGPAYDADGIIELPTFGSARAPTTILDSWTYLTDRRDYALGDQYSDLMIETVDIMRRYNIPGILSWYADPCHVAGQVPFQRAMRYIADSGIQSLSGTEVASMYRGAH